MAYTSVPKSFLKAAFFQNFLSWIMAVSIFFLNFIAGVFEGFSFYSIFITLQLLSEHIPPTLTASSLVKIGYFVFGTKASNEQLILLCIIIGAIFQAMKSFFQFMGKVISSIFIEKAQRTLQTQVYDHIFSLPYSTVCKFRVGDLIDKAVIPQNKIPNLVNTAAIFLAEGYCVLISFAVMFRFSKKLTLLCVMLLLILGLTQKTLFRGIQKKSKLLADDLSLFSKNTTQSIQAIRPITIFNRKDKVFKDISSLLCTMGREQKRLQWNILLPSFLTEFIGTIYLVSFVAVGKMIIDAQNSAELWATLVTFLAIANRLVGKLQIVVYNYSSILSDLMPLKILESFLKSTVPSPPSAALKAPEAVESIQFDDISLKYPDSNVEALSHVDLFIKKGEKIAFVGESGAGKSSMLDLLLRLFEPTGGKIAINGNDLVGLDTFLWREKVAVVSQDTFIFNDSLEENVRFGNLLASKEEVAKALSLSHCDTFLAKLPERELTVLGERGYRLSGGERQRIALARALVRNAEILILDECTSNLDSQTEASIMSNLEELNLKQTVLMVAHRLSTIAGADRIYVFKDGRIIESGTHHELLSKESEYAKMWSRQNPQEIFAPALGSP